MYKNVWLENGIIIISFQKNLRIEAEVKTISGRRWHKELHAWKAPLMIESVRKLISLGFVLSTTLELWYQRKGEEV